MVGVLRVACGPVGDVFQPQAVSGSLGSMASTSAQPHPVPSSPSVGLPILAWRPQLRSHLLFLPDGFHSRGSSESPLLPDWFVFSKCSHCSVNPPHHLQRLSLVLRASGLHDTAGCSWVLQTHGTYRCAWQWLSPCKAKVVTCPCIQQTFIKCLLSAIPGGIAVGVTQQKRKKEKSCWDR